MLKAVARVPAGRPVVAENMQRWFESIQIAFSFIFCPPARRVKEGGETIFKQFG